VTAPQQPPRLLLVLAHGVGERELAPLRAGAAWSGTMPTAPLQLPEHPVAAVLDDFDAARQLHDLGVAVDRSSLVLRPAGRTDATAILGAAQRATGPADVTLFEARDVLQQAMVGGPVALAAAAQQLGALLDTLGAVLRRVDAPEVWLIGLGSPVGVRTTFDLAAAWREHVLPPLANELTLHHMPGSATVRADNQRALDLAANTLRRAPFAQNGRVQAIANGQLHFTAAPHVAFAARPLAARAPLPHEANGIACAPLGDLVRMPDLDLAQLMARFWTRAAALHVELTDDAVEARTAAPQMPANSAPAEPLAPVPLPQ